MSEPSTTPAPKSRGRSVLLIVSLCLNVALIAMIVAGIANAIRMAGHPKGMLAPQALLAAASTSERPQIQAVIDAHAARVKELEKAEFTARRAALEVFAQPNLNADEFKKALDAVNAADDAVREEQIAVMDEAATKLSASERAAMTEKAHRRIHWWLGMRRHMQQ
jgi:uncharacterized membrane protein